MLYTYLTSHLSRVFHFLFTLPSLFFFFNDPATTEIYTLSLHDALPISSGSRQIEAKRAAWQARWEEALAGFSKRACQDRKSTRLNSSHVEISYAVFCLKKKKKNKKKIQRTKVNEIKINDTQRYWTDHNS